MPNKKLSDFLVTTGMNLGHDGKRFEPGDTVSAGELFKLVPSKVSREDLLAQGHLVPQADEDEEEEV